MKGDNLLFICLAILVCLVYLYLRRQVSNICNSARQWTSSWDMVFELGVMILAGVWKVRLAISLRVNQIWAQVFWQIDLFLYVIVDNCVNYVVCLKKRIENKLKQQNTAWGEQLSLLGIIKLDHRNSPQINQTVVAVRRKVTHLIAPKTKFTM